MRIPLNTPPGTRPHRITSSAIALSVDVYRAQPGSPGVDGTTPVGKLPVTDGELSDDASQAVQRTMTLELAGVPTWLAAGMWLRPTIGVAVIQPAVYELPTLVITEIERHPDDVSYATVSASDPAEILNTRPYEADTAVSGTLRAFVAATCAACLTRPVDVSGVPTDALPADSVAEFGAGRWDVCVQLADALGIALMFTDRGDVIGRRRSDPLPDPVCVVELVGSAGRVTSSRTPTAAKVYVDRGDVVGILGTASVADITGVAPPAWYLPYVVTDQVQLDATATAGIANTLARDLLRQRLADLDTFDRVSVLPTPWLEANRDTVTYQSAIYGVRAMTLSVPTLATTLTLRRVP